MQKCLYIILILFVSSCTSYPEDIETVLKQAGSNRKELVKVLKHYGKSPADSLKLRAAEFLIANMPGKYSEYYDAPWNDVATVHLRWSSSSDREMVLSEYQLGVPVRKYDVTHISADYLINNIELAFQVWQAQPWGKTIPFDVFCEEILPYRVSTEPLENWRKKALASFAELYQSFVDDAELTSVEACKRVNDRLPRFRLDKDFPTMNYSQLMASTRGMCDHFVALAIFSMRALGIPVTHDFTHRWPGDRLGHSWNSVRTGDGVRISFLGTEVNPGAPHQGSTDAKGKVYRYVYANRQNVNTGLENIPPLLRGINNVIDVTSEYALCADARVPVLNSHLNKTGYAFLSVLHENTWNPIGWGTVDDEHIQFRSAGKNILYLPVFFNHGVQSPASYPFMLNDDGTCQIFKPDTAQMETIEITHIFWYGNEWLPRMKGGRFEGANRSDFSDARQLYVVEEVKGATYHTVDIQQVAEYRYIRYCSPKGAHCNVAELEFYDTKGVKRNGSIIGPPETFENTPMKRENVFDGDINTFFDAEQGDNAWVGLDFGKPVAVSKIRFFPRTNENRIYAGDIYKLFYWDGKKWQLLDERRAADYLLRYRVPANAMFFLQNLTGNKNGHYFVMKDGKQKWN